MIICGMIGEFSDEDKQWLYRRLLAMNMILAINEKGGLTIDEATDSVLLVKKLPAALTSASEFETALA